MRNFFVKFSLFLILFKNKSDFCISKSAYNTQININNSKVHCYFLLLQALSHSVRDRLIERWHDTQQHFKKKDPKRLYFLSLEFLMGKFLFIFVQHLFNNKSFIINLELFRLIKIQDFCFTITNFKFQISGRSLSNSVINLGIKDQCAEALSQLGFEYEVLAEQVKSPVTVTVTGNW